MKASLLVLMLLVAARAVAEKQSFDRYQSIVDRQMFGPLPPNFDPTARPSDVRNSSASERELSKEQEKLRSAIRFSAIDVRPSGEVAVGFADNSDPKKPKIYFLKVGETRDGWTVKEADRETATMTVVNRDGVEVSLTLGEDSGKGNGTTARAGAAPKTAEHRPALLSLGSRRRQRQQAAAAEQAKAEAERQQREAERQAQAEQEKQQREAERAEQRQQLLAIQEELKRVREARAAEAAKPAANAETEE